MCLNTAPTIIQSVASDPTFVVFLVLLRNKRTILATYWNIRIKTWLIDQHRQHSTGGGKWFPFFARFITERARETVTWILMSCLCYRCIHHSCFWAKGNQPLFLSRRVLVERRCVFSLFFYCLLTLFFHLCRCLRALMLFLRICPPSLFLIHLPEWDNALATPHLGDECI